MPDPVSDLADAIASGLTEDDTKLERLLSALFSKDGRYHSKHWEGNLEARSPIVRDAYGLARGKSDGSEGVPWGGLIHADNPPTGAYGGMSLAWFPTKEHGSLMSFVVGTRGLAPDEGILTRPGHRRRIAALRRHLRRRGIDAWTKPDPAAIGSPIPETVRKDLGDFGAVFKRYGDVLYCVARVPKDDPKKARELVAGFLDLYAYERGWNVYSAAKDGFGAFIAGLRAAVFENPTAEKVHELLKERRFVVLQGPPGTGKTRMAEEIQRRHFDGRGFTVQFHPSVTYEDFVVGLAPETRADDLRFRVRSGWLAEAVAKADGGPALLIVDEINRADLGKVLGEAIYLFEPGEPDREIRLPHPIDGAETLRLPPNLFVLGTLNTADRSIASIDLAIRRRFAFVTLMPDRSVLEAQKLGLATRYFDRIADVFVEHVPDEALALIPGHAYFLAKNEEELRRRFRYELIPLLEEYLREGYLGPAASELHAVRDALEDEVR